MIKCLTLAFFAYCTDGQKHVQSDAKKFDSQTRAGDDVRILSPDARTWTSQDVSLWASNVLEYPFLGPIIEENKIDGLTLLSMTPRMIRKFFLLKNDVHQLKIETHIGALRGTSSEFCDVSDYWSFYNRYRTSLWTISVTSIVAPRLTIFYIGHTEITSPESLWQQNTDRALSLGSNFLPRMDGPERSEDSFFHCCLRWVAILVLPHCYFVVMTRMWVRSNFVLVVLYALIQTAAQFHEVAALTSFARGHGDWREALFGMLFRLLLCAVAWGASRVLHHILLDFLLVVWITYQVLNVAHMVWDGIRYMRKA